jgi:cytochrome b involved in lipid metabolism
MDLLNKLRRSIIPFYSIEEVRMHKSISDCWVVIDNHVIDITRYLKYHPGGMEIMLEHAGTDATDHFNKVCHGDDAYEIMLTYRIGRLI